MHRAAILVGGALLAPSLPAAATAQHGHTAAPPTRAVAVLTPTSGNTAQGIVTFEVVDGGVRITARFEGLSAGSHGFHIHEFGDCSAPDGTSAGGHFNPTGEPHGAPDAAERHIGDLGNLEGDTQGMATYDRIDRMVSLTGPQGVIGRGLIVHAAPDDLTSQPTGAAGPRLACGVIGIAR